MQNTNHDHDEASASPLPSGEHACSQCGESFAVTRAEQTFRLEHRLGLPDLCPECRAKARTGRNAEIIARYEQSSDVDTIVATSAPSRPGKRSGSNVRGQMYATVCDACGNETRVPFVPRGDRPVYCRDCYNARRGR